MGTKTCQLDAKLKPIMTWSPEFSRPLSNWVVFTFYFEFFLPRFDNFLPSDWLLVTQSENALHVAEYTYNGWQFTFHLQIDSTDYGVDVATGIGGLTSVIILVTFPVHICDN